MSVVVEDPSISNSYLVFTKGAPEKIRALCDPKSIPGTFNLVMDEMTTLGYRVLAAAYKRVPGEEVTQGKHGEYARSSAERALNFLGFLIMQNKLKPDSASVISRLRSAEIAIKVISGDNPLTTIQTAKEANIIPLYEPTYLCDVQGDDEHFVIRKFASERTKNKINSKFSELSPIKMDAGPELEMSAMVLLPVNDSEVKEATINQSFERNLIIKFISLFFVLKNFLLYKRLI